MRLLLCGVGAAHPAYRAAFFPEWLSEELDHVQLSDEDWTGHLPKLVEDLPVRLSRRNPKTALPTKDIDAIFSVAAVAHGKLRYAQGYTPEMLVHESRILQVPVFETFTEQHERTRSQLVIARCHDHRRRTGCPVDAVDGYLIKLMKSKAA